MIRKNNIFIFLIILLMYVSCKNSYESTFEIQTNETKNNHLATISISVVSETARTILPNDITFEDISKTELIIKKSNEEQFSQIYTWETVQEMIECKSITLVEDNYDFLLNLYVIKNSTLVLCQSGEISNKYVSNSYFNELVFYTSYIDELGSFNVNLQWKEDDRIAKICAGLFTFESDGTVPEKNFEMEELHFSCEEENFYASYSKSLVPKGYYFLRFELYSQDGTKINVLEDIIRITGNLETNKTIELSSINTIYNINYVLNGAEFVEGFVPITTRIANKAIKLPAESTLIYPDSNYVFLGWYTNPDFLGDYYLSYNAGKKGDITLYARFEQVTANNIIQAIDLLETSKTIIIKENEEISPNLIRDINTTIRSKTGGIKVGIDFSKTSLNEIPAGGKSGRYYTSFYGCNNLSEIILPKTITKIGNEAFYGCIGLTDIIIPSSVTEMGREVFKYCKNLRQVEIQSTFLSKDCPYGASGYKLFDGCEELYVNLGLEYTKIGSYAFYECSSLKEITIPEGITSIGQSAFSGCSSLKEITIPEGVTSIEQSAFSRCSSLKKITLPEKIWNIGDYAFSDCQSFTQITIPSKVTKVGKEVFKNCKGLRNVEIKSNFLSNTNSNAPINLFSGCEKLHVVLGCEASTLIPKAFYECTGLESIEIPISITSIGGSAFYGCSSLKEISILQNVTSIGGFAFSGCSSLREIVLSEHISEIGNNAFENCSSLSSIIIPSSVQEMGDKVFKDCTSLRTVEIKSKFIESQYSYEIFNGCEKLNVILSGECTGLVNRAFYNCVGLEKITLPDTLSSIGDYAFYGCSSLKNISIPESVTTIGSDSFENCTSLSIVTIPDSVTEIGYWAFAGCKNLSSIKLSNNINTIPSSIFNNCSNLIEVYFPSSIISIDSGAFNGCSKLPEIIIPDTVTSIGNGAFLDCESLTEIIIPAKVTCIEYETFKGCTNLKSITIPSNVISMHNKAFQNCSNLTKVIFEDTKSKWYYSFVVGTQGGSSGYCIFDNPENNAIQLKMFSEENKFTFEKQL